LLLAQSPFETWSLPIEALEQGTGPAISVVDLATLRCDLEQADVVDQLKATLDAA
jgi:hypothetical protein